MADVSQYCSSVAGDPRSFEVFTKEFVELKKRVQQSKLQTETLKAVSGEAATGVQESNQAYKKILS